MRSAFLCFLICLVPMLTGFKKYQGIIEGNNRFAFKLFSELNAGSGNNNICSPFSISTAMAMTYAGAMDSTALQMSQTMNFPRSGSIHDDFKNLLEGMAEGTEGKFILNIANGLWAQQNFRFLESYIDLVKSKYHAEINNVNFADNNALEFTRNGINEWVQKKTNDKIIGLLKPSDLGSSVRLVLVNAIYFYGEWATPFEKSDTRPMDFFPVNEAQTRVPFMNRHGWYNYYEDVHIKALELPYRDNKASMLIILPREKAGIEELEKSFDFKYYNTIIGSLQSGYVRVSIPKFRESDRIYLNNILSQMGMPLAFSSTGADFSGMTGKKDLYISTIIHQAFVNVDELGTEAAASTAVIMKLTAIRIPADAKDFKADHPFIFLIKDNTTGSILFIGRIMNPGIPL